jgi:hypothetical protein
MRIAARDIASAATPGNMWAASESSARLWLSSPPMTFAIRKLPVSPTAIQSDFSFFAAPWLWL